MRTRNLTIRVDNGSSSLRSDSFAMTTPSLSLSSSSGSPSREALTRGTTSSNHHHRTVSPPSTIDHTATPLLPSFRATPSSPGIRRTLTYSPTKGAKTTRRITTVLLGLIFVSVFLTMLCTILLLDDGKESDAHIFGAPTQQGNQQNPVEPFKRIRGGKHGSKEKPPIVTNLTETLDLANDNGVPIAKEGTDKVTQDKKGIVSKENKVIEWNDIVKEPHVNEKGLKDELEEMPDKYVNKKHQVQEPHELFVDNVELNSTTKSGSYPRVIFLEVDEPPKIRTQRDLPDDPMLHAPPGFEAAPQDRMKPDYTQGDCVPMHDWQTKSFPNCNLVHEYDLKAAGPNIYKNSTNLVLEDNMVLLGQGWFRHAWRLSTVNENVILKTLRLEREFYDEYYDLHRRDAVAMERLTHSPFIMDIYGYCGQSALNELAEFGNGMLDSLEKVDRRMRGNDDPESNLLKLQLGASVAVGVAHIHEIDDYDRPSMVHYDINPRNVAIVGAGKPKINDFNIAEFLHWNPKKNETCGFPSRLHEPWWRAPEEVSLNPSNDTALTAAVDVYALGSVLFHILTTHSPRGKMKKERAEEVREKVLRGEPPFLEDTYKKSKDPSIVAFRKAMKLCFKPDPKKRGTSRQVADIMLTALLEQKKKRKAKHGKRWH